MATVEQKNTSDLGDRAVALAEQLGRIAGTIEGTAESWVSREKLATQLTRVRDSATEMLQEIRTAALRARKTTKAKRAKGANVTRMAQAVDPARAAGKKRRKPSPTIKGAKKSDERIPKLRTAAAVRQRRKSYA